MILDRIYVGPATSKIIGFFVDTYDTVKNLVVKKIKTRRAMTLEAELAAEEANRMKNKQREVSL